MDVVDIDVIRQAVGLACRAPSLHNSQPWRWVADRPVLQLFADPARIGRSTDSTGREVIISCGAVLDHLRVAMAAAGWQANVDRFPNPDNLGHLASVDFTAEGSSPDAQRARAEAIRRRRTDRLSLAAPPQWYSFAPALRDTVDRSLAVLDVIPDDSRPQLAEVSRLTEELRREDSSYHAELQWWTMHSLGPIPPSALVSEQEAEQLDVSRRFPTSGRAHGRPRSAGIARKSSSYPCDDSRGSALGCGEMLSSVLLECTIAGLATCTLTHMIEVTAARELVRRLIGKSGMPQALIRVGVAPETESPPPPTTRRSLSEVLEIRR